MSSRQSTGRSGEDLARKYLENLGLQFRAANVRGPLGEIDLLMFDSKKQELVMVEVKTRSGTKFGIPEESITNKKQLTLRKLAAWCCQRFDWNGAIRVDVVGIVINSKVAPIITHTPYAL